MNLIPVDLHLRFKIHYLTIHSCFQITFLPDVFKQFAIMSFPSTNQWSKQADLFIFEAAVDTFNDFLFAELHHPLSCIITVSLPRPCKQQSQEIVNLSNGTDSTAWIFICCFLFDGNNRR